jgi:hypothetical protein
MMSSEETLQMVVMKAAMMNLLQMTVAMAPMLKSRAISIVAKCPR